MTKTKVAPFYLGHGVSLSGGVKKGRGGKTSHFLAVNIVSRLAYDSACSCL